jgi:hypothetical protein
MAFADDFVTCMSGAGIQVDASAVPDADSFRAVIQYVNQYLQNLDSDVREALDAATKDDAVNTALADPEVGAIDAGYAALLHAFDQATGYPLSLCLQWCEHCLEQAAAATAR